MGTAVAHPGGPVRVEVDLDRGEAWEGRRLGLQVLLRPGTGCPPRRPRSRSTCLGQAAPVGPQLDLGPGRRRLGGAAGHRPHRAARPRATGDWARQGRAIAYASPFWLERPH